MTDVFDRATELEEQQRQDALQAQARRAGLDGKTVADSASHCGVCGCLIPVARRRAVPGVQTCVVCQEDLEQGLDTTAIGPRRGHNKGVNHA